jgi:Flp pilus assembly pilin Flp
MEKIKARMMTGEQMGGQGGSEYAILVGVIVVIVAIAVAVFGPQLKTMWDNANKSMTDAAAASTSSGAGK